MPTTHQVITYKFSELSDEAKEKALEKYRSLNYEHGIHWQAEILDSLKALLKEANITLRDFSLGLEHSYIKIDLDDDVKELRGKRAIAWLENNLLYKLRVPWRGIKRTDVRKYGTFYYPEKIKPCPFTGVCFDEEFLDDLRKNVKAGHRLEDSFLWLADKYQEILQAQYDDQNSEEYLADHFAANDYEFLADGERY